MKTLLNIYFFDVYKSGEAKISQFLILVLGDFDRDALEDSFGSFAETDMAEYLPYNEWVKRVLNGEDLNWVYILPGQEIPACNAVESIFI